MENEGELRMAQTNILNEKRSVFLIFSFFIFHFSSKRKVLNG